MRRIKIMPNLISSLPEESALPALTDRVKDFITVRLARREPPERIAAALRALFTIEIEAAQVVPYWRGDLARPSETEARPDKESVQCAGDAENEPLFTQMADSEMPQVMPEVPEVLSVSPSDEATQTPSSIALNPLEDSVAAHEEDEASTQTGHRQNDDSLCIPVDTLDEPSARDNAIHALGEQAKARHGLVDPASETAKSPTRLTDEVKAFIVRGLARYETPTRVALSVKSNFGIEIDRRQVFAYDPAGSRPPAQRWIDLHAATRAKFLRASAEIGITQKTVRLRMLDRLVHRADQHNQLERTAALLAQAAKECGGFYERYARPKAAA
jgi:hypothetical protein